MRDVFHGYIPLQEEKHAELLRNATIVLDTNALLNLYRYTPKARNELLVGLRGISQRLWIPHQVAHEFHQRRVGVIREQQAFCDNLEKSIGQLSRSAASQIESLGTNPFVETKSISARIARFFDMLHDEELEKCRARASLYAITPQNDSILEEITALYDRRVGPPYSNETWASLRREGDERFENQTPPGFNDQNKDGDKKYGDFIIWKQILDHASSEPKDVIFVTDDGKDDWWWTSKGERLGPHPQLRAEFFATTGRIYYAYRVQNFVQALNEVKDAGVSKETVDEVREISAELERNRWQGKQDAIRRRRLDRVRVSYGKAVEDFEHQQAALDRMRFRMREIWPGNLSNIHEQLLQAERSNSEVSTKIGALSNRREALKSLLTTMESSQGDGERAGMDRVLVEIDRIDRDINGSMHELESSQRLLNEISSIYDEYMELHKAEERAAESKMQLRRIANEMTEIEDSYTVTVAQSGRTD